MGGFFIILNFYPAIMIIKNRKEFSEWLKSSGNLEKYSQNFSHQNTKIPHFI